MLDLGSTNAEMYFLRLYTCEKGCTQIQSTSVSIRAVSMNFVFRSKVQGCLKSFPTGLSYTGNYSALIVENIITKKFTTRRVKQEIVKEETADFKIIC
jgi:hypothetical protein